MADESIDILQESASLLSDCRTASLATVDDDGRPHAANIQYVHDERLRLYFVSSEDAAHSQHAAARPARHDFTGFANVMMTPHISGWSEGTLARRVEDVAANLECLRRGEPLRNVVEADA